MQRPVPEWIGDKPDSAIPERVWLRVLERHKWRCAECKNDRVKKFQKDHIIALVNWVGEPPHGNRETNLQPLCEGCHALKTGADVAVKAKSARCKKMRPGYYNPETKRSTFKSAREGKWKYNWSKRRYERVDEHER